jgi:UDP-N-acetylmuramate: L-alanyl-gamma-D-glutamyl-meso-diaminopimelate ligase
MHAFEDNPEIKKAQELWIKMYSFPEFIYEMSKDKQRVVIGWSHGKTTTTSMLMHILRTAGLTFDWLVGASVPRFENMVSLSNAPIIVIEWDEYPDSRVNLVPKFLKFHHTIGLVNGIAWDHVNTFPTFEWYADQFKQFIQATPNDWVLFYNESDEVVKDLVDVLWATRHPERSEGSRIEPYRPHPYVIRDGVMYLVVGDKELPLKIFGEHNMTNFAWAQMIARQLGISDEVIYQAIQSFEGAGQRLQLIDQDKNFDKLMFLDFAHSPSKATATVNAVKAQYPDHRLVALFELHTFSSLTKEFLPQYASALDAADVAWVIYPHEEAVQKRREPFTAQDILDWFWNQTITVFMDHEW